MTAPYGYLAFLALLAVPTLAALAARPRPGLGGMVVFYLAVAVNETPFIWLALLAASTALTGAQGDLTPAAALAGALVAAGLLLLARRGAKALEAVEAAMAPVPVPHRLPYGRIALGPLLRRRRSVEHVADLAYGPAGRANLLDLYRGRSGTGRAPVLVHFYGGGYNSGRKDSQSLPLLYRLAEAGWVCVSANYRLRPEAGFEDHLADVKRVIAWIKDHGPEWGADPDRIVLAGSSAGAHLAASAALTAGDPALQPGFEDADTAVAAVVGFGGYYGPYYGRGAPSSPLGLAGRDAPPFFLAHGDRDTVVPIADARRFAAGLRRASARPVVFAGLPGGHHAFDLCHSLRFDAVACAVEAFAAAVLPSP
ncbi:alpha/beta hydrolase [Glycomyces sp. A-F 0318]|uniref:alpha/beta hydrolase n=1 Tax=Glycomyces amatae TaxID=2881355 RepID=UPI001E513BA3|nr:alpha/beta hydrolase [Glycomyces amatae]MCD0447337.1 alpha/beta hydrolase [Glycomyces amatae]